MGTEEEPVVPQAEKLSQSIHDYPGDILVVGHSYPDPDCMAAAIGMEAFLRKVCGRSTDIVFGSGLGRAENRAMAGILDISYMELDVVDTTAYAGMVFVDTQPGAGNCHVPDNLPVLAVIDHHLPPQEEYDAVHRDVRSDVGSSCTIVAEYLEDAGIPLDERLATALLIGIRTDTEDLERDETDADVAAYLRLYGKADRSIMQAIMRPPLSEGYFAVLREALASARRWGDVVVAVLGPIPAPDLLSEVAELFSRLKDAEVSLAVGEYGGRLHLSLRMARSRKIVFDSLRTAIGPHGRSGGHGRAAGGRMDMPPGEDTTRMAADMVNRFLTEMEVQDQGPKPVCVSEAQLPEGG